MELRTTDAPMPLIVHLVQGELQIGDDPGFERPTPMMGLVGSIIVAAIESGQNKKARAQLEPILTALGDYDANTPLMSGILTGLSGVHWVSLNTPLPLRDNSYASKSGMLDSNNSNYLADADCSYRMGIPFHALYVICHVQVAAKTGPAGAGGEVRWKPNKLMYDQTVETEVALDLSTANPPRMYCDRKEDRAWCQAQWQANSAALLRAGLNEALQQTGELVGRLMSLLPEEIAASKNAKDRRVKFFAHEGVALEGLKIVQTPYSSGFLENRQAKIEPDNSGILILQDDGNLYLKRTKSVR